MKKSIFLVLFSFSLMIIHAQHNYTDFIGAGHDTGIRVTTSHDALGTSGAATIDGFNISDPVLLKDASRFLAQATLGYDFESIQLLGAMGYNGWIDYQYSLPTQSARQVIRQIEQFGVESENRYGMYNFRASWWEMNLKANDILRKKITHALSQIFVISSLGSDLFEDVGLLSAGYYDVLNQNAFGNYRDILREVSRNPAMGLYLSHINNPKSDPANNIHPDENYAREIMQLFSIGLYELNNDGTRRLDSNNRPIPTYDADDIREFAKIFTGFGNGSGEMIFGVFGVEESYEYGDVPMKMYDEWHEPGSKQLLNGQLVPAGQTGMQDFEDAIDNLFYHPNVGPFIGKALIQFLVTSNPSPAYVGRVANAFNNNGQGVRGDLKAVVKAILLDPEARNCQALLHPTAGKLREPITRYVSMVRAFNPSSSMCTFFNVFERWYENTGQIPFYAPSVFNFYLPDFQPNGAIADQNLVAPVFQIHNSSTAIGYINEVNNWIFNNSIQEESTIQLDFTDELSLVNQPGLLVDRLDILLASGQLSSETKNIIVDAVTQVSGAEDKVNMALYLVLISPEFAILK